MFGRRRHVAVAAAPIVTVAEEAAPRPRLAEEQIFELVHTRIAAAIGDGGEWVVRRRTPEDTDELFRSVLAHQIALDVATALRNAQVQLEAGEPLTVTTRTGPVPLRSAAITEESAIAEVAPSADRDVPATEDLPAPLNDTDAGDEGPAHRHAEPEADDLAELDEDAIALQWEPAPITVWTDLKKPVTGTIALQRS